MRDIHFPGKSRTVAGLAVLTLLVAGPLIAPGPAAARGMAPRDATVASLNLAPLSPLDIAIDATGSFAYAVTCSRGPTAEILRINLSTFTVDDSATLTTNCARAIVLQDDSIFVTTSDRLYRINASTFGPSGPSTTDFVAIDDFGNALDVYGSFAYIGHHAGSSGNRITKVNVSGSSMSVASTFASGGNYPMSLEIDPAGTFAYVTHTISHSLAKIRLSDDSVVASLQVGQQPYGLALDDSGAHAYVPSAARETFGTLTTPPWLVRVNLGSFTIDDTVTLPFYWAFGVDVNASGTTAYVGQDREGANLAKVDLGPSMSVAETITVQNSPSSPAINPASTFVYTANSADLNGTTVSKVAIVGSSPAPSVSGLSRASGPLSGGGTVTVSGDNLTGATSVSFGGTAATILSGTDDTVAVTAPSVGSAGTRNVTVTTAGGTSTQSVPYTYVSAPTVTGMAPTSGPRGGATVVTISGSDLSGATVDVGGTQVAPSSNTGTSLTFSTPASAAGPASVTVTTPGGSAAGGTFTYLAPPPPIAPSAPQAPTAIPGNGSAQVSWDPVASPGTFPATSYQVNSSPSAGRCLTAALSCEITGLTNGTAYTFSVRALSGAGWGAWSPPSAEMTPHAPAPSSIVISGSRGAEPTANVVTVTGRSDLESGTPLRPWVKVGKQPSFRPGMATVMTSDTGAFEWSRRATKSLTVYFGTLDGAVASNRVTFR